MLAQTVDRFSLIALLVSGNEKIGTLEWPLITCLIISFRHYTNFHDHFLLIQLVSLSSGFV